MFINRVERLQKLIKQWSLFNSKEDNNTLKWEVL